MRVLGALLLVIGGLLAGLRVVEHVAGGFIGEASVAGVTFVPFDMPLAAIGLVSLAVGTAILRGRTKHSTGKDADPRSPGERSNTR